MHGIVDVIVVAQNNFTLTKQRDDDSFTKLVLVEYVLTASSNVTSSPSFKMCPIRSGK